MSLKLPLKLAIFFVVIGSILFIVPLIQGNYSGAGSTFIRWLMMSAIVLAVGLWDNRTVKK